MAKKPKGYYSKGNVKSRDAVVRAGLKQIFSPKNLGKEVVNAVMMSPGGKGLKAASIAVKVGKKTSPKLARAIATEAAGKGAKAPYGIYRKPARSNKPRLRDTDNTPRKTTVRQQIGPKTKSGKFTEPKKKPKTNTQPPVRTKPRPEPKAKFDPSGPVTPYRPKYPANMRLMTVARKREARARAEYAAERARQAKLAKKREVKEDTTPTEVGVYSKSGKKYTVKIQKDSKVGGAKDIRPSQPTIESRLASGSEKLPLTARNQAGTDRMPPAEWRRYAQQMRDSQAKGPNVTKEQIARGRDRALMSDKARREKWLKQQQARIVAKAKARGMTDAQIRAAVLRARKEAEAIARKAAK